MARNPFLRHRPNRLSRATLRARTTVQAAAFWIGVLLPLTHVPLLVLVDLGRFGSVGLVVQLLVANVVACVLGHGHDPTLVGDSG